MPKAAKRNASTKAERWIGVGIAAAVIGVIASSTGGSTDSGSEPCEDAYRYDYVFYGEPGAMSMEDYCDAYNDKSLVDDMGLDETYK